MSSFASQMESRMKMAGSMSEDDKLYRFCGVLYPRLVCPEENLRALPNLQARTDDIMLVAYPKCGFNWMVGVLRKIITESTGKKSESKMPPLIEFFGPDVVKNLDQTPSPRLLGTHLHPDNIPPSFYSNNTKMLVVFRNPKDTVVSFFHFFNNNQVLPSGRTWDSFFSDFMSGNVPWGSYFDHVLAWEKRMNDPNVMIVTYEELKEDLGAGVRQISCFFGLSLSERQVEQITEQSSFSAMKQESAASAHTKMTDAIFRKGEVGDWRNHFTAEQSKQMDEMFHKHLAGSGMAQKLKYNLYC